jgi:hypothetical protein
MSPNTSINTHRLEQANRALEAYIFSGSFSKELERWSRDGDTWSKDVFISNEADQVERHRFTVWFRPRTPFIDRVHCVCIA